MNKIKQNLNVAVIGQGFMWRAHSNAFQQVNHFFETQYELPPKIICGRNRSNLKSMARRWGWEEIETPIGRRR